MTPVVLLPFFLRNLSERSRRYWNGKVIGREGGSRLGARGIWRSGEREVVQCDLALFFSEGEKDFV